MSQNKARIQAVVDRMKEAVGVKSDVDLAETLGASRSQPAVWKSRNRMPLAECVAIAEKKGVSLDWLVFGKESTQPGAQEPGEPIESLVDAENVKIPLCELGGVTGIDPRLVSVPRSWLESCGVPYDDVGSYRNVGDEMSPTIGRGDVLFVDYRRRDMDGLYVVQIGSSLRVRRVQRAFDGALHLITDNPNYTNETIKGDQAYFSIIGYCFAHLRFERA